MTTGSGQKFFEDFAVGDRFESPGKTLTDAHFLFFAGLTGDAHPLHYDDEYVKSPTGPPPPEVPLAPSA